MIAYIQSRLNTTLNSLFKQHVLVGLHINCSRSDYLEEQKCPVRGPLGAPLHSVKHATYLQNNAADSKALHLSHTSIIVCITYE